MKSNSELMTSFDKGVKYELVTKAIFEEILKQDGVETVELKHRSKIRGLLGDHEIDVYWEFTRAGIPYKTIVQAKDLNYNVKKLDVLAFKKILDGIPGQPRGVIVTKRGFQKGAEYIARKTGIQLYRLRPYVKEPIVVPSHGWFEINVDLKNPQICVTVFNPEVGLYYEVVGVCKEISGEERSKLTKTFLRFGECSLYDEHGIQFDTMTKLIRDFVTELRKAQEEMGSITRNFGPNTFVRNVKDNIQFEIKSVRIEISIKREELSPRPLLAEGFVRYILTDLQTNSNSGYTMNEKQEVLKILRLRNVTVSVVPNPDVPRAVP